jgi:hypothetical protein
MMRRWIRGSRGLQTLEWVALGLVILALMGAVAFWITYQGSESTGRTVEETITHFFECVKRMDLDCVREGFGSAGQPQARRDLGWCLTHPVDCWREVVWPTIQRGAKAFWEGVKWVGHQIAEAGRRAWAWIVRQWNTWLKGTVAGLLAAALIIVGIIVLVKLGIITVVLAIAAAILATAAAIIAGIVSQLSDPSGGFWAYFRNALAVGTTVAGLVISAGTAIAKGLVTKWLASGFIPAVVSGILDGAMNLNQLMSARDIGDVFGWFGARLMTMGISYLTSLATWGLMQNLIPAWRAGTPYTAGELIRRYRWLLLSPKTTFVNMIAIVSVSNSLLYLTGVLTGQNPGVEEYISNTVFSGLLVFGFEIAKAFGLNEWISEFIQQISQQRSSEMIRSIMGKK